MDKLLKAYKYYKEASGNSLIIFSEGNEYVSFYYDAILLASYLKMNLYPISEASDYGNGFYVRFPQNAMGNVYECASNHGMGVKIVWSSEDGKYGIPDTDDFEKESN